MDVGAGGRGAGGGGKGVLGGVGGGRENRELKVLCRRAIDCLTGGGKGEHTRAKIKK